MRSCIPAKQPSLNDNGKQSSLRKRWTDSRIAASVRDAGEQSYAYGFKAEEAADKDVLGPPSKEMGLHILLNLS